MYHGNNTDFYSYFSSETRIRPNITLTLGLRHEYKGVPYGDTRQWLNALSSVPGVLTFGEPKAQKRKFAPRAGLAYSPGSDGKTVIRAGFGHRSKGQRRFGTPGARAGPGPAGTIKMTGSD